MKAIASILRCFNRMDVNIRNESILDVESFKNHESWEKLRYLANQALKDMQEQNSKPDLSYLD